MAKVAPFSMLMFYSHFFLVLMVDSYVYSMYSFALVQLLNRQFRTETTVFFHLKKLHLSVSKSLSASMGCVSA